MTPQPAPGWWLGSDGQWHPPPAPAPDRRGGAGIVIVFLLGVAAWLLAFAAWSTGDDGNADAMSRYSLAVALAIVGAALIVVAAIYDSTERNRR